MAVSKVYNGTSWVTGVMKVWNGSAWIAKAAFWNGSAWIDLYGTALSVVVGAIASVTDYEFSSTAYAWYQVDSDGDIKTSTTSTSPTVVQETWLDAGLNSQVWVEASISGTALEAGSSSTGSRLACTSDRKWGYTAGPGVLKSGTLTVNFYDAASGGTLLDTQIVSLSAEQN